MNHREILQIVAKTLFYFLLLLAILLFWDGHGLFLYENF